MKELKLNFLNKQKPYEQRLISLLESYGNAVTSYAKEYFSNVVTTGEHEGDLYELSLYIMAPEISYNYRVLSIEIRDVENVLLTFYPINFGKVESTQINISDGLEKLSDAISVYLSSSPAATAFKFLVDQINLKRNSKSFELPINNQAINEIEEVYSIGFSNNGTSSSSLTRVTNVIDSYFGRNQLDGKFMIKFNFFTLDIVFLFFYTKTNLIIAFCDKNNLQPFCIWETPQKYDLNRLEEYCRKYLNYYFKSDKSSTTFFDFFSIIHQ